MKSELEISKSLSLPLDFVTATQAILARKGSGKSYTASVQAEEMLEAGQQIVVIDPTGAWWGLRASASGKSKGYPIAVLGGDHADVPLEEHAGETVARAIVEERFSAVIDLSHFRKGQVTRFMTAFLETLYVKNREALHLFIDEADAIAPQRAMNDKARCLGAAEDVVRRGRLRGIGCTMITQRPAVLNKNVLTQCEVLTTLRLGHHLDIGAIQEWINVHAEPEQAKEMIDSLPTLPIGTAWVWSPHMNLFEKVKIRKRRTFDSGATPKAGKVTVKPKILADVDVEKLGKSIQETVERAKENDPKRLKAEIAQLKRKIQDLESTRKVETVEVSVLQDDDREILKALHNWVGALFERFPTIRQPASAKNKPRTATPPKTRPAPRPAATLSQGSSEVGNGGLRRILTALAQRPQGLNKKQIGVRAGLSSKSGSFNTYLSKARSSSWIENGFDGVLHITELGLEALGAYDLLPTGPDLLSHWLQKFGSSGAARILTALSQAYPDSLSRSDLGEAAGLSAKSGSFNTYLSKLRTLELIEGSGDLRMSDELS